MSGQNVVAHRGWEIAVHGGSTITIYTPRGTEKNAGRAMCERLVVAATAAGLRGPCRMSHFMVDFEDDNTARGVQVARDLIDSVFPPFLVGWDL